MGVLFGLWMLVGGAEQWRDHRLLHERGVLATAHIVEVHDRRNTWLTVRFETVTGETIVTDVADPSTTTPLRSGATMRVRYDPHDPANRIEDANDDQAVFTRWFPVIVGLTTLAAVGYGHYRRRRSARSSSVVLSR